MSDATIHVFNHRAMATVFQVRIAGEEASYAAQASRNAFELTDRLEALLSRFRENSDIRQLATLQPSESLRVSEPTFACLEIALRMTLATRGAFSISPASLRTQAAQPKWSLRRSDLSVLCESGRLEFDLGAIGKGFALDRMAGELAEWDCPSYLLVAGGSSILAGSPPLNSPGWSSGLGDNHAEERYWLAHCSLSGSGVAAQGEHILDPRTGQPARQRPRAWALANSAAESDALSTACMVLEEAEISQTLAGRTDWLAFLQVEQKVWRHYGSRPLPAKAS